MSLSCSLEMLICSYVLTMAGASKIPWLRKGNVAQMRFKIGIGLEESTLKHTAITLCIAYLFHSTGEVTACNFGE
uniref:Secreted protein n=1 Tax=Parascaris equorum TaxID=6256 RepID=A0A914RZK0_PAREQ